MPIACASDLSTGSKVCPARVPADAMIRVMTTNAHDESWAAWQSTPWGRLRYRVMSETLRRCLADLDGRHLRILDVGGADGADSIPLAAGGHDVTVLDRSSSLLDRARDRAASVGRPVVTIEGDLDDLPALALGEFDVVLCHNVLQYHREPESAVAVIAAQVRPAGMVSLMCPNPCGDVLGAAIRLEDPTQARALLNSETRDSVTFGTPTSRLEASEVSELLTRHRIDIVSQYGLLAVTTYIANNGRKSEPDFYAALEELELSLCDREPYLHTAAFWQVVGRKS